MQQNEYPVIALETAIKAASQLEPQQLDELIAQLNSRRRELVRQRRGEAIERIHAIAATVDMPAAELMGAGAPARRHPPRYQHPDDAGRTWSGLGRMPGWVRDWKDSGRAIEDLQVIKG